MQKRRDAQRQVVSRLHSFLPNYRQQLARVALATSPDRPAREEPWEITNHRRRGGWREEETNSHPRTVGATWVIAGAGEDDWKVPLALHGRRDEARDGGRTEEGCGERGRCGSEQQMSLRRRSLFGIGCCCLSRSVLSAESLGVGHLDTFILGPSERYPSHLQFFLYSGRVKYLSPVM